MSNELKLIENYSLIRQPYRITMSMWNYSVWQKRILTKIISKLQKNISLLERGAEFGQLELFKNAENDTVKLHFLLTDFIKDGRNYAQFKKALNQLRSVNVEINQIVLPAVKSRKAKKPEEELILTGLIERVVIKKYARDLTITMHKATAMELMKVANGLTVFAEDVMYKTDNKYTQKIYEIICQWKDIGVYVLTIARFKELLVLGNCYPHPTELIRRIIKPAQKELKQIGDVYFEFSVTKQGRIITNFNFIIKTKVSDAGVNSYHIRLKEDAIYLLRQHLGFKQPHIDQLEGILNDHENIPLFRAKITELSIKLSERRNNNHPIQNIPAWVITSIKNEFLNREK